MKRSISSNTLQEDLDALGVKGLTEDSMAAIALGRPLDEKSCKDDGKGEEDGEDEEEEDDGEEYDESRHDPIDGPFVTPALFDRIMALPFDNLDESQIDQLIGELSEKKIPKNIPGIEERAQEVARTLVEKKKTIIWKGRRKRINIDTSGEARAERRERRLKTRRKKSRIKRQRIRTARKPSAKRAAEKTAAAHQRMGDSESFAVELEHLLHEQDSVAMSVRDEILLRIDTIIDLIEDEFEDDSVDSIFESVADTLFSSYDAGRLDEDVMGVDAFLAEVRPIMSLISKSLDKMERADMGNE